MNLQGGYTKDVKRLIEKIRMPSGQCQSCLSDKSTDKDYMLTCKTCQSAIHNKHYGREINQPVSQIFENWKCERCRILTETDIHTRIEEMQKLQCQFCPSKRGILKRVIFNNTETIWLHPECWTWPYPIIYQKNRKQTHYNSEYPSKATGCFWVNLQDQKKAHCQICNDPSGYKIKCCYYTCKKYYHCSCAKSNGVVRDLQSMHFENSDTYIPPYCQEHLSLRVEDCATKRKKYKAMGDEGKASHFNQMMQAYQVQLKNMNKSAQKFKEQQQIRLQMQYQRGEKEDLIEEVSFEHVSHSYHSVHNQDFILQIFDKDYPIIPHKQKSHIFDQPSAAAPQVLIEAMVDQSEQQQQSAKNSIKEQRPEPIIETTMKPMINIKRPNYKASPRQSDNEQSQWGSNQDLQELDEQDD